MDGGRSPELHCYQKGLVWALGHVCRGLGQPWNIAVKPRERDSTSVPNPYTPSKRGCKTLEHSPNMKRDRAAAAA